ncbi:MAG: hypothetical protein DMD35_15825 [Gemmatimonadetes bacterium]|nr:MAG: hypothetical protein DMD35_15825 [Gemmatimonadota bacterium]
MVESVSIARHFAPSLRHRSSARAVTSAAVHWPRRRPAWYSAIVPVSGSGANDTRAARGSATSAASCASASRRVGDMTNGRRARAKGSATHDRATRSPGELASRAAHGQSSVAITCARVVHRTQRATKRREALRGSSEDAAP